MSFTLPPLPYAYDALQPYMSKETLEFHHDKHHATYVTTLQNLVKGTPYEQQTLEDVVKNSFGKDQAIFNNAGQHLNHSLFWHSLKPGGGGKIPGALEAAIVAAFGSVDKFKEDFVQAALTQFGSGWAWLVVKDGKLSIAKTANAETPLVHGAAPLITADVWEHTYYIDYRNRRADYAKAFVEHLINWEFAEAQFAAAK